MKTPTINSRILKLEVLKDTATRASVNAVESRTTSLESDVSTLQGNVATLTQGIQDAVSTHNTAPDSHADLRTAISDLMSNVEEVDADFVSISYNPSGGGGAVSEVDPDWPTSDYEFEEFGAGGLIAAALASGTPVVLTTNGTIGGGELADLVDHATDDIYISGAVGTYVQLDFGGGRAVAPSYFAIRNNSYNYDPLRNWEWRGSNDLSTWDVLDARINDTTLNASSVWGGWEPNTGTGQYFRYLRLVRTGATGGGGASYIRIGEIDVFGSMIIGNPLPSWATCWVGDDTYMWPARQR